MAETGCYSITTKKFVVFSEDNSSFAKTQELYNEILRFYYNLYLDHLADDKIGAQQALRQLEKMTIPGRDRQPVPYPLPWEKVPLYFRRAAVNAAIAAARSFFTRSIAQKDASGKGCQKSRTERFTEPVTFYKGMYRDFTEKSITLKLWDGQSWNWHTCRLGKNTLPKNGRPMSPSLVLGEKCMELHVPVKVPVEDGRNARERMNANEKICAAVFTNQDAAVVCCILNEKGEQQHAFFARGGLRYAHCCRQILQRLEKSRASSGEDPNPAANRKYWMKLKHLNDYHSHKFSRQVVDYCKSQNAKILVLPKYDEQYAKYVMLSAGNFSPIHLSTQIREKLKYKAWREGIVVLELEEHYTSAVCSICGKKVKRRGGTFTCENGHQGNTYLNTARNLGRKCLEGFGKQVT